MTPETKSGRWRERFPWWPREREALAQDDPALPTPPRAFPERRLLRVLVPVMLAAIALAVGVNWVTAPPLASLGPLRTSAVATRYEPGVPTSGKPPLSQLPGQILAYETIARQGVPGRASTAAEAVYVTLNVNLEMQLSMSVYARVEAFASGGDAKLKQAELMAEFPQGSATTLVGATPASTGFNADSSAYAVTWVRGEYVTFIKTTFKDHAPATGRDRYLRNLTTPVVSAVDTYQRTGKEGIQIGAQKAAESTSTTAPKSQTSTRPAGVDAPGGLGF